MQKVKPTVDKATVVTAVPPTTMMLPPPIRPRTSTTLVKNTMKNCGKGNAPKENHAWVEYWPEPVQNPAVAPPPPPPPPPPPTIVWVGVPWGNFHDLGSKSVGPIRWASRRVNEVGAAATTRGTNPMTITILLATTKRRPPVDVEDCRTTTTISILLGNVAATGVVGPTSTTWVATRKICCATTT
jgi:hypothetical protein